MNKCGCSGNIVHVSVGRHIAGNRPFLKRFFRSFRIVLIECAGRHIISALQSEKLRIICRPVLCQGYGLHVNG